MELGKEGTKCSTARKKQYAIKKKLSGDKHNLLLIKNIKNINTTSVGTCVPLQKQQDQEIEINGSGSKAHLRFLIKATNTK